MATITGLTQAIATLKQLDGKVQDNTPIFKKAVKQYRDIVGDQFKHEGGTWGTPPWDQLSPLRVRQRTAVNPARGKHPILNWYGSLRDVAMGYATGGNQIAGSQTFSKTVFEWTLTGGKTGHAIGYKGPQGYVPRRNFWPWTPKTDTALYKVWEEDYDKWFGP